MNRTNSARRTFASACLLVAEGGHPVGSAGCKGYKPAWLVNDSPHGRATAPAGAVQVSHWV